MLRLARTLFAVQAYVPASMWAADALELQLAIYGEGAIETAEYLEQAGECALWAAADRAQVRVVGYHFVLIVPIVCTRFMRRCRV